MKKTLSTAAIEQGGISERFVSAVAQPRETPASFFDRMATAAAPGQCVALEVFGGQPDAATLGALRKAFPAASTPATWVCEADAAPGRARAAQAWVVSGAPVQILMRDGMAHGTVFEDEHVRYVRAGGLLPRAETSRRAQTRAVLEDMLPLLHEAGMDFSHVVRTWFYNDDILAWYADFNAARDDFFREQAVGTRVAPASTGMGGGNPAGRALTASVLAVRPKSDQTRVCRVDSPLQCPASDYGSAFSRAVEIATPSAKRLLVSGTASIAPEGHTLHVDDVQAQIAHTFRVVYAMLDARGMGWEHVTRAIGYFKPGAATVAREAWEGLFSRIPAIPVTNHVCRDDLLFETEVDAIAVR
ncbi:MAG: Rid family hydrolase [Candidatus Hydrogenedentota bacterium]